MPLFPMSSLAVSPKIISLFNQAGGVAKTTLAMNLGYQLAQRDHRVLLIDLDPQDSLTVFQHQGAGDRTLTYTSKSLPVPPKSRSLPFPPSKKSLPPSPRSVSLPAAPLTRSLPKL